jgi:hypothetical protein
MSKSKLVLDRRTVLRGMVAGSAVRIGLPVLGAMLNSHGTAFAAGQAFPRRFGVWFYGCGLTGKNKQAAIDNFFPKAPGPTWEPTRLLMPLAPHKQYVTVVGGTEWGIAENTPHHTSRTSQLSGSYNLGNVGNGGKKGPAFDTLGPSIDRIVADAWKGQTRVESVEMACSKIGKYCGMISFQPTQIVPSEFNPANVFKRLFGAGVPAGAGAAPGAAAGPDPLKLAKARRSVLDAVVADARALQRRVGKTDGARLEAHLGGLREVENQIAALEKSGALGGGPVGAGCRMPEAPPVFQDTPGHEDLEGLHKAFTDMLVIAMACDLTRVFSMEFTATQSQTIWWQVNFLKAMHDAAHSGGDPDPGYLDAAEFSLKQFAYLVDRLKTTPEGTGNLLDSMGIYCVNEYLVGASHSMKNGNHPILIVGKAGGALRSGQYLRPASVENGSKVCLALLRAMDIKAGTFGLEKGMATEPLPGLLAV